MYTFFKPIRWDFLATMIGLFLLMLFFLQIGHQPQVEAAPRPCRQDGTRDPAIYVKEIRDATAEDLANPAINQAPYTNIDDPTDIILSEGDPIGLIRTYRTDFDSWDEAKAAPQFTYVRSIGRGGVFEWHTIPSRSIIITENEDPSTAKIFRGSDDTSGPSSTITIMSEDQAEAYFEDCRRPTDPVDNVDDLVPPPPNDEEPPEPACTESFSPRLGWLVCVVVDWVDTAIESLIDTLNTLLSVSPEEVNTSEMRKAWSYFRNIASLLLVIIGLVMIIGQASSKD